MSCPKVTFYKRKYARKYARKRPWLKLRTYQCPACHWWHNTSFNAAESAWARANR